MRMLLALVVVVAACSKNNEPPPPSKGVPMAKQESGPGANARNAAMGSPDERAHKMYETVCSMCHGPGGQGNGPASESLNPKPRNYTDAAWQASVTDDEIKKTILLGGQAVGKSAAMPGQPQLKEQPEVLDALVKIIRGFNSGVTAGSGAATGSAAAGSAATGAATNGSGAKGSAAK